MTAGAARRSEASANASEWKEHPSGACPLLQAPGGQRLDDPTPLRSSRIPGQRPPDESLQQSVGRGLCHLPRGSRLLTCGACFMISSDAPRSTTGCRLVGKRGVEKTSSFSARRSRMSSRTVHLPSPRALTGHQVHLRRFRCRSRALKGDWCSETVTAAFVEARRPQCLGRYPSEALASGGPSPKRTTSMRDQAVSSPDRDALSSEMR